jgi:CheY-like chemotaxis protein
LFLEIRISDSGLGITPEFMPYVFDRFRQGDASLTRQYGGLGLGLAIVKQLVELHGGTVHAESQGEGQGSSFIIKLPVAPPVPETKSEPLPSQKCIEPQSLFKGLKVLVIDDELDARELIRRILAQQEASVITAARAADGLELLKTEKPDIVISDISMPEKNGYQFITEVRSLSAENGGTTPAIALTAFAHPEDRAKMMSAGYQKHLPKPVDSVALITAIDNLVGSKKLTHTSTSAT